jgi:hypothetical protein
MCEHLDRTDSAALVDPVSAVRAIDAAADALDAWYRGGCRGPRPPGRLRHHRPARLSALTRACASLPYRILHDPDGRPRRLRRTGAW